MSVYQARVKRAQNRMVEQGIDVLLILGMESYRYFTGDVRKQPRLLIPAEGEPILIVFGSEKDEVERSSWIKKVITYRATHEMMLGIIQFFNNLPTDKPKVGIEMIFSTPAFLLERFKMAVPQVEVVDAAPVIAPLRKIKDSDEIRYIREACRIADKGMETAINNITEGAREIDVAIEAEYAMKKDGAEGTAFPIFVNSGYRSLWLHGLASEKTVERNDLILIDMVPVYKGYCANLTRTVVLGKPDEKQRKLHSLYLRMQDQVFKNMIPGIKIFELEDKNQELADKAGFGEYYIRGFVHGIGLAFEETPFPTIFPEDIMETVSSNMTMSVGHSVLSAPGIGGVRVEDTTLVGEEGVEVLTKYSRELLEVG